MYTIKIIVITELCGDSLVDFFLSKINYHRNRWKDDIITDGQDVTNFVFAITVDGAFKTAGFSKFHLLSVIRVPILVMMSHRHNSTAPITTLDTDSNILAAPPIIKLTLFLFGSVYLWKTIFYHFMV